MNLDQLVDELKASISIWYSRRGPLHVSRWGGGGGWVSSRTVASPTAAKWSETMFKLQFDLIKFQFSSQELRL